MRFEIALFGLTIGPIPLGTFSPMLCRTTLLIDVRAEIRFFTDGILTLKPRISSSLNSPIETASKSAIGNVDANQFSPIDYR